MDLLVIAPTATYKRGGLRKEVDDAIKNSDDAVRIEQKINIVPKSADKTKNNIIENRIYQDFKPMRELHKRNRNMDLYVYNMDALYERRPMYNISLPEMKLRKQT